MYQNTNGNQEREIKEAGQAGDNMSTHVSNLISIIEQFDSDLIDRDDRIKELEGDLRDAQNEVARLEREVSSLS